ncbi:hypothetical protein [[Clostridium] polysaccharolyticum]|uniref:hypothetical protein n=1 Tax=[Clostridium] polysaccharolyticum TaxID=29364 RepID=UPI0015A6B5F0|nr:hypothetical protein [[Clostridium] polysaccharolyticum]
MSVKHSKKGYIMVLVGLLTAIFIGITLWGTAWTALHLFQAEESRLEHRIEQQ